MKYEKLFEPGKIGNLIIRNRTVMTAMGTGLPTWNGEASDEMIRYYHDRAKGGVGLIITEFTRVDEESGQCNPFQLCIANRKHVRSVGRMVETVHRYGAKMFIQLQHGGREALPALNGGKQPIAPSAVKNNISGITPKAMTVEEIGEMVDKFVAAAANSQRAGADGVELHASHGYLLCQFMSPYTNKRNDQYGGLLENNCRIITEIIQGIRAACGPHYPVSVRVNAEDFVDGGIELDYAVQAARLFEAAGASAINVSSGVYESVNKMIEPNYFPEGWRKHLAKTVKANIGVPVIAVNTVKHPSTAETLLQEGVSDFVGVSRGHVADPEWTNKAKAGREDLIRKCIGCMNCNKSIVQDRVMSCAVNPVNGRATFLGDEFMEKNGNNRTVAIIGGGPAGMQAALVLAKRGFRPVIFEQNSELGGTVLLASRPPHKTLVHDLVETQKAEMREYGVEVRLNTTATVEEIKKLDPCGVIVACGGKQIVPNVPGRDKPNVYGIEEVLTGQVTFSGKEIAVIGGGISGLETAHYLCGDNKVAVVETQDIAGSAMYHTARNTLLGLLADDGVEILTGHAIASVEDGAITMTKMADATKITRSADVVIWALGCRPDNTFNTQILDAFDHVSIIGDADAPGTILDATRTAYDMAFAFCSKEEKGNYNDEPI